MSIGNTLFSFKGRLNRKPYWLVSLAQLLCATSISAMIGAAALSQDPSALPTPVMALRIPLIIVTWWIGFALGAKRLHDRDKSAWFLLLAVVPLLGWFWFLVEAVRRGTVGSNRFGPDPLVPRSNTRQPSPASREQVKSSAVVVRAPSSSVGVAILLAIATATGGAWYYTKQDGGPTGETAQPPASNDLSWDVGTKTDEMHDTKSIVATATHQTDEGGRVILSGTCDDTTIALNFEYHAKKDADSRFDTEGTGEYVHIPYRFDKDDLQEAISKTNYINSADVVFAYQMAEANQDNASAQPGDVIAKGIKSLVTALAPGLGPQDLRGFLHANEVRFQLPLGGGLSEIIHLYPQESSFQGFVAACKIDVKRFDDDFTKQQAAAKAAEKAKSDEEAREADDQKEKEQQQAAYDAAKQDENNVRNACILGGRNLRVTIAALLGTADAPGDSTSPRTTAGQIVTTLANNDSTRLNGSTCEVEYSDGGNEVRGFLPWTILEPADTSDPAASAANQQ